MEEILLEILTEIKGLRSDVTKWEPMYRNEKMSELGSQTFRYLSRVKEILFPDSPNYKPAYAHMYNEIANEFGSDFIPRMQDEFCKTVHCLECSAFDALTRYPDAKYAIRWYIDKINNGVI